MLCLSFNTVYLSLVLKKILFFFLPTAAETISKTAVDSYLTIEGVACLYLVLSVTIYFDILQTEETSAFNKISWITIWKWDCPLIPCLQWIWNITPVFTEIPNQQYNKEFQSELLIK